jgi:hypothetical protein
MTSIALRIDKSIDTATDAGAVVVLHRLSDTTGAPVSGQKRLDTTVPAGGAMKWQHIEVDPGQWWIEATLPSGEIITNSVTVNEGKETEVVLHAAENSLHEWLGWQHLVGNIEGRQTFDRIAGNPVGYARDVISQTLETSVPDGVRDIVESTLDQYLPRPPTGEPVGRPKALFPSAGAPKVHLSRRPSASAPRGDAAWSGILDLTRGFEAMVSNPFRASPDEGIYTFRFDASAGAGTRDFVEVQWGESRYVTSLPLPWPNSEGTRVPAELLVRLRPADKAVQLGLAILDKDFGTLAGLMTASSLPKASIFVEQARGMLFEKMLNPLAAAAGAYVLLSAGETESQPEWHRWIDNLANNFADLPDGAVLQATKLLRYSLDDGSYDAAKASLFKAFDRGIPYYSAGVAWLLDGLTLFAEEDPLAKQKMQKVQLVAQRLDVSQAFTVIRLIDKQKRK